MAKKVKKIRKWLHLLFFLLLLLPSLLYSEAKIEFGNNEFNYGSLQREGIQEKLPHIFAIKNTGTSPLEITSAKSG